MVNSRFISSKFRKLFVTLFYSGHIINYTIDYGSEESSKYVTETPNEAFYTKNNEALVAFDPDWQLYSEEPQRFMMKD